MPTTQPASPPKTDVATPEHLEAAALPPPGSEDVLYLVDLSGYVFRAYHAIAPLSSSKGEPTHAVLGTLNMLNKVVADRRPTYLAVAMDSTTRSFRKDLDPRYKANRPPAPADLQSQMVRCEQLVRAFRIPIFQKDGLEADDFIAAVVTRARASKLRVVIVSADKDLMQLVDDVKHDVVMWDSMRDRVFGPREVWGKFGVPPSKVRDLLALTGDSSDNVPGVPGVGPKTASDLLLKYGSLEGIYGGLASVTKAKLKESLTNAEADARLSQKLVTLKADEDISWDLAALRYGNADQEELRRLYTELDFTRLLKDLKAPAPKERTTKLVLAETELAEVVGRCRQAGVVALDVETTTPDPMQSALLGISLSPAPGEAFYVPVGHRYLGAPAQLAIPAVARQVGPLLAEPTVKKVAHNLKLVAEVLRRHDMPVVGAVFDTLLASYLLDPEAPNGLKELASRELGITLPTPPAPPPKSKGPVPTFEQMAVEDAATLVAGDADVSLSLASRFEERLGQEGLGPLMNDVELPLSRVLEDMEMTGVLVDVGRLEEIGRRVEHDLRSLEARAKAAAGHDFSVRSRDQLEKILFDELKLPVLKRTPKGGRSTDAEVLEELAEKHELPKLIVEFRELDKLKGTYIELLPRCVNPATGRIHSRFSQTVAATGRLSSSDPNLQNIPIRTEVGREIRGAFVAPPGHLLVSADYSQIELRVLAHLSKDAQLLEAFRTGEDVHTRTARLVFNVPPEGVTAEMRRHSKAINFGVIYGMGDAALGKSIGIPREEAAKFIAAYFERYAGVAQFLTHTIEAARKGEAVRTILGRRRFLPNLHSANRGLRMEAERICKNTPIQGTAADILKLAMVRLGQEPVVPGARMILTVHDELVFEVPEARVAEAEGRIREAMMGAMKLDVPLVVDVGHGPTWAEAH